MSNPADAARRHRRLRVARRLLSPLVLALALPASAQATWTAPVNISGPGQDASAPQVAVDPNGNAVFVWERRDGTTDCGGKACLRIQARARSASGVLSPVQTLSAAGQQASDPQVAVDPNGNAVFVWEGYDGTTDCGGYPCDPRIHARARSASGVLSPVQRLSPLTGQSMDPRLGLDQGGNAVFVWQRWNAGTRVEARARSAAGTLSAIQTVHPDAGIDGGAPNVAVNPSGNAVFVWSKVSVPDYGCGAYNEYPCFWVQTRVRSAAGTLSPIQGLSAYAVNQEAGGGSVAVDPNGNAVFVWRFQDWNSNRCYGDWVCGRIQARARSAAGTLSGAPILSAPGGDAADPELGVDQSGNAVFVWQLFDLNTCDCTLIQARARSAAGALSATQTLSGDASSSPDVAVDPNGNAVFVWSRLDGTTGCPANGFDSGCVRVQARARSAAGTLGPVQTLSAPGQDTRFGAPVGIDQNGHAVAVWSRFGGANWRIQAAAGP